MACAGPRTCVRPVRSIGLLVAHLYCATAEIWLAVVAWQVAAPRSRGAKPSTPKLRSPNRATSGVRFSLTLRRASSGKPAASGPPSGLSVPTMVAAVRLPPLAVVFALQYLYTGSDGKPCCVPVYRRPIPALQAQRGIDRGLHAEDTTAFRVECTPPRVQRR